MQENNSGSTVWDIIKIVSSIIILILALIIGGPILLVMIGFTIFMMICVMVITRITDRDDEDKK